MILTDVPVIDIAPYRTGETASKRRVAAAVGQACRDIGFLVITGHGVPARMIADVDAVSRAFFDLPLAEKMKVQRPAPDITRGYIPIRAEALERSRGTAKAPGDLNESLMIGPVDAPDDAYHRGPAAGRHFHPNLWPNRPTELRALWTDYFRTMEDLAQTIMRLFALALDLPEQFFDDKIDRHISRLRVRNYPEPEDPPVPGQIRAGAHTDYGSLTILKAEANPGGLQVCNKNGNWVTVPIVEDCYIVNIGDMMARWTNDRWVSTLHRVINPPADQAAGSRRQSLVFFHNPNYDAEIRCLPTCLAPGEAPKYQPTSSGEHLRTQFMRTQAY